MPQIIDGTQLNWQKGTFSSTSLAAGTPFYQNCNADNNARMIATTPVALHGEGAVFEAATGWYVQVYGVDADLNYLGQAKFASAAGTVNYTHTDVAYAIPCLRRADGTTNVYPTDVTEGLLTVKVSTPFASKHIDGDGLSHFMTLIKRDIGDPQCPYNEVEWVESNGKQYVYLDWKPPIATWGFEADFLIRNTFNTTAGEWRSATNANNAGMIFGTRNASTVNDVELGAYGANGYFRNGGSSNYSSAGLLKTDKTRQQVSYRGTSLKRGDGTTVTFARSTETANKPYSNMTVFCYHDGVRRAGTGNVAWPSTTRIYSLKFYDGDELKVDLVGAIRNRDGVTGLYDKVAEKFYPAPGMTHGVFIRELGDPLSLEQTLQTVIPQAVAYNDANTRMLQVDVPSLKKLEDGQKISLTYLYAISASYQTSELAGWDDTGNNSYVYLKVTLSDGTQTEWIPCYWNGGTRLTTHYYAGYPLLLTYRENVFIGATATASGSTVMRGFWCDPDYNTDTTRDGFSDTVIAGKNGVKRYTLCMRDDEGNWTSIVNEDNNAGLTGKTAYTGGLMPGMVLYMHSNGVYAAGANTGVMNQTYPGLDFRYSVNGVSSASASTTLQLRKPVYLVGTIDPDDGLFYLDTTLWWTQAPSDTTKVYILVGWAYSSYYAIFLSAVNPTYVLDNGKLVEYDDYRICKAQTDISDLREDVNSIELGGRNKIRNTRTMPLASSANWQTGTWRTAGDASMTKSRVEISNGPYGSCWGFQLVGTQTTTNDTSCFGLDNFQPYVVGEKYTVSMYARVTNGTGMAGIQCADTSSYGRKYVDSNATQMWGTYRCIELTSAWKRVWVTFEATQTAGNLYIGGAGTNATIQMCCVKFENGTTATDWTPAPEDLESRVTTAETKLSGIASGAEVNQNAFSNVKVGSTTVAADTTTDTLELAGSNVTLTPDTTNDKVTIGITASNVTTALGNTAVARATGDASGNAIASTYVKKSGDTMTGNLVAPAARFAKTYYGVTYGRTTGTPVETILYTGIKWVSGAHMPVVHVTGYAYGLASPVEFKIAFYIYNDKIGWCGATNMGSWNPALYAFKYTRDSVNYVAIGFSGSCYFLQLQADVQDEMGAFANIDTSSTAWSWSFLTTTGTIPAADGGTTCVAVPYKADILTPNVSNVTGTVAIAHGGTGATTADAAWTALGGGAIGKKASLAASDIPNLAASKITSGTFDAARIPEHASTDITYGMGSDTKYGHLKLSDTPSTLGNSVGGVAATPKAVFDALAEAKTYADGKNNQNAFSNVKVGSTTVAADTTTDTLELAGSNVTLTPDATNDKVTIGITASNVTSALGNTAVARATADASGNNIADTYANQNAFSNVKVGSTTVAADTTKDTLELVGSNVTLTPDATNDKVTIGITASNVTTALGTTAVARATGDANGNAIASTYLNNQAMVDGVGFVSGTVNRYVVCGTAAGTAVKDITVNGCKGFSSIPTGLVVYVEFSATNTAAVANLKFQLKAPPSSGSGTVNVGSATAIKYRGANLPSAGTLAANRIYTFVYDGTNWELVGDLDTASSDGVPTSRTINGHALSSDVVLDGSDIMWEGADESIEEVVNRIFEEIPTGAEANQNAFSNVKVGSTTIAADSKTDTLTLAAGSHVTLTPDATNDKVTIAADDTTYTAGTGLSLSSGNEFSIDATAARNAMGLGNTTGALPIANGGTGATAISVQTLTPSSSPASTTVFTPASGITITQVRVGKWGRLAQMEILFKHTAAWTTGTQYGLGTVTAAYRPAVGTSGVLGSYGVAAIVGADYTAAPGAVYVRPLYGTELTANSQSYVRFPMYITNQ